MTVKTAISLDDDLIERVDEIAHDMDQSRSGLISIALRDFLRQYENQQMLAQINEVYADTPTEQELDEEQALRSYRRTKYRRLTEGTWLPYRERSTG